MIQQDEPDPCELGGVVLDGQAGGSLDDRGFRRAISLSIVSQVIGHIAHHVDIGDTVGAARNVSVLRRALAELGEGAAGS